MAKPIVGDLVKISERLRRAVLSGASQEGYEARNAVTQSVVVAEIIGDSYLCCTKVQPAAVFLIPEEALSEVTIVGSVRSNRKAMVTLQLMANEFRRRKPEVVMEAMMSQLQNSQRQQNDDQKKAEQSMHLDPFDQDDEDLFGELDLDGSDGRGGDQDENSLIGLSMGIVDRFLHHKQAAFSEAARHRYYANAQRQSEDGNEAAEPTISIGLSAGENELYNTAMSMVQRYLNIQGTAKLDALEKSVAAPEAHRTTVEPSLSAPAGDVRVFEINSPMDFLKMLVAGKLAAEAAANKPKAKRQYKKKQPPAAPDTPAAE